MSIRHNHTEYPVTNPTGVKLPVGTRFKIDSAIHSELNGTFLVKDCPTAKGGLRCNKCHFNQACIKMGSEVDRILPQCNSKKGLAGVIFVKL